MPAPSRLLTTTVFAALALGGAVPQAQAAQQAPADGADIDNSPQCHQHPYRLHASAARLLARPSTSATVIGIAYPRHRLTVTATGRRWVRVQDHTTGVNGWASSRVIYRAVHLCLD
jgi:Bacterial SH3 domain